MFTMLTRIADAAGSQVHHRRRPEPERGRHMSTTTFVIDALFEVGLNVERRSFFAMLLRMMQNAVI